MEVLGEMMMMMICSSSVCWTVDDFGRLYV